MVQLVREQSQIEIFRASGRPVDLQQYEEYAQQWRIFYDKAATKAKLDMQKLHRYLSFGEHLLQKSYQTRVFCQSFEECRALMEKLSLNMLLGISSEDGKLVGVLQDV